MSLDEILAAIARLAPRQRDRLWRRARQMGLLEETQLENGARERPIHLRALPRSVVPERDFVADATDPAEPTAQLPEATPRHNHVKVVFDGGSKGNPGPGYGSYVLAWNDRQEPPQRLDFGDWVTNNEAEYDTLIAALEDILLEVDQSALSASDITLEVWGDSQLVINQVKGDWRVKEPRLAERCRLVQDLLARFGEASLHHQPRSASVALLGH